ncbi:MAG: GTP-binding protein, partial [Lachnospiraceae bacterium]|nr:GTP-binding protein [Lachnospiraceae bacterium]
HHDHEHHHDHDHEEGCCCGHDHDHDHHEHHYDENGVCSCGHHHHDADEVFTSWGSDTARKYTRDEINAILKALSEDDSYGLILRAKGMVADKDGGAWIHFDMVPEEFEVRDGAAMPNGKFCVIGSKLNEDKLAELFK